MNQANLSKCVKMAMTKKGIDTLDMSKKLSVGESTVANYRAGKVRDIQKLSDFAEACDMTFNELMALAD